MLHYRAFRQQLAREGCRKAYLLIGEEDFLKDRACLEIARSFLGGAYSQDAVRTLYATDIDGPGIVEQCINLGLFQQRQVMVVKEADALSAKSRKAVVSYLERPSPDTCLVLSSRKLEDKSPFTRDAGEHALVVMFSTPGEDELARWLSTSAREMGFEMDREAAETLVSIAGTNMGVLARELDKLGQYLGPGPGKRADKQTARELAGLSSQASPADLAQAVSEGDRKTALEVLQQLMDSGEDPARLVTGLFYQMEHLWKVKLAGQASRPQGTIDRRTFWGLKNQPTSGLSRKRGDGNYLKAMEALFSAEQRIKTGGGDARMIAVQAVQQLITQ